MKKLIVFCSIIVALGFVAPGCGGGESKPTPPVVTNPHAGHDHSAEEVPAEEAE